MHPGVYFNSPVDSGCVAASGDIRAFLLRMGTDERVLSELQMVLEATTHRNGLSTDALDCRHLWPTLHSAMGARVGGLPTSSGPVPQEVIVGVIVHRI